MALVPDQKFSTFQVGGNLAIGDILVGLRGGINTQFTWTVPVAVTSITGTASEVLVNGTSGSAIVGDVTLSLPQGVATTSSPTFAGLTLTGTPLGASSGGTGVNNGSNTLTLAGTLATIGAYASTFTMTGATNVTFPTSGTLATVGGTVSSISGTANQIAASASTGAVTLSIVSNPILPGAGGFTLPTGNTAARAGIAGTMRFNSQTSVFEATVDGSTWATIETSATSVLSVSGTANRITSTGGTTPVIDIAATYVGQTSITTLGTIGTGTWQGSNIGLGFGGTNASLTASNGGIFYSTASAAAILSGTATANQVLLSGSSTTPAWSTATYPATTTINQVLYSSSANVIAGISAVNSAVMISSAGGVPSFSTTLPAGLTIPGYQTTITPAALTKTDDTNVTLTLGGTPSTALLQATSLTLGWTGQLSPSRGGTGVNNGSNTLTLAGTLATSGAFASTFTMTGVTNVTFPTSGTLATTAGTVSSITGTANQIAASASTGAVTLSLVSNPILPGTGGVTLPSGNTAARAGGAGTMRFNSQTSVFEATVDGSTWATIETSLTGVLSVSGTTNRITSTGGTTPVIDISASYVGQSSITTLGTISTGVWNGTNIDLGHGGTNASLTASNGGIIYSTASAMAVLAGTATAGQMLQSGASTTPGWSTSTYPATNAVNTLLYASSANVMAALATANSSVLVTSAGGVPSLSTTLPNINIGTPSAGVLTNTTGGGGLRSFQVFTSGSAATYTKPANVTSILVEVVGGGGGGGGATSASGTTLAVGGGGGSGGYARLWVSSASSTYTYTVGAGGTAGANTGGTGGTGGTTTFSASSLQATGGTGGVGSTGTLSTAAGTVAGGTAGIGSNGNFNSSGAPGNIGGALIGAALPGLGGSSQYGGGGAPSSIALGAGTNANNYGSGGSGAIQSNASSIGGTGSAGIIIVWEFS